MRRIIYGITSLLILALIIGLSAFISGSPETEKAPFTTTVNPRKETIAELEIATSTATTSDRHDFLSRLRSGLAKNIRILGALASPSVRYVKVYPGMRKEEIAMAFGKKLDWTADETAAFIASAEVKKTEGYFYPDTYVVMADADGPEISEELQERFDQEVASRYPTTTRNIIDIDTAIKIASIIQREAGGKSDMRLISGVIWNRVFEGMNLQMDATLQYAKGNEKDGWWPQVRPEDKYIESPYNTYQNEGFPPTPISNPSINAIDAALNPQKTECIFYLHDRLRRIHCAKTYEQHLKNIDRYY